MENHLAQYATIAAAFGLHMSYNSSSATLEVRDVPKGHSKTIEGMLKEIEKFDDTTSYVDGVASFCVAAYIDDEPNPIPERARANVLHALGIMKDDLYIHQVLMLQKNNRSWHRSGVANSCEHFGEICTHRGINPDPNRTGRTSSRKPDEYHRMGAKEIIAREQLVTPNLEKMFRLIPEDRLTSGRIANSIGVLDLKKFKELPVEEKFKLVDELQGLL